MATYPRDELETRLPRNPAHLTVATGAHLTALVRRYECPDVEVIVVFADGRPVADFTTLARLQAAGLELADLAVA